MSSKGVGPLYGIGKVPKVQQIGYNSRGAVKFNSDV